MVCNDKLIYVVLLSKLGPVVHSFFGLTKSLVEDLLSLTVNVLTKSIAEHFLLKKIVGRFCNATASHIFFSAKHDSIFCI